MTRAEEFQMLQELVNTAGSLNHGNNIVANIKRLEEVSNLLRNADWNQRRDSFMGWLRDNLHKIDQ